MSGSETFSMTDKFGIRLKFWKIKPISLARNCAFLRDEMWSTLLSLRRYWPEVGRSSRPMMFSRVVLPQPDGPIIIMNSPRLTVRSKL